MTLFLTGGHQRRAAGAVDRDHEVLYDRAVLAAFDPETGTLSALLDHRSAARVCGGDPDAVGHTFKAGSRCGEHLWLCTEREALRLDPAAPTEVLESFSAPCLNDVHHAAELGGRLHLAASGLDAVVVRAPDGSVRVLDVTGAEGPLGRAIPPPDGDLRGSSRKPHLAHPNHVAVLDGRRWVTRGALGDAVCLDGPGRIPVADVPVHDGVPFEDGLLFTAVDGRLLLGRPGVERCERVADLRSAPGEEPPGWCRGVAVVDGVAWVGFTRIRATRLRQNLAWLRGRLRGRPVATRRPTRLVGVDLASGRVIAEHPLAPVGLDAVFSVIR